MYKFTTSVSFTQMNLKCTKLLDNRILFSIQPSTILYNNLNGLATKDGNDKFLQRTVLKLMRDKNRPPNVHGILWSVQA